MTAQEITDKIHELKKEMPDADSVIMPYSIYKVLLDGYFHTTPEDRPPILYVLGLKVVHFSDKSCRDMYLHKNISVK